MIGEGAMDLGPAWSAHLRHGKPGTFTAVSGTGCGRVSCGWKGEFTSDDGTDVRQHVSYSSSFSAVHIGDKVRTQDLDGSIYPANGGSYWYETPLGMAMGIGFLALGGFLVRPPRWARNPTPPVSPAGSEADGRTA